MNTKDLRINKYYVIVGERVAYLGCRHDQLSTYPGGRIDTAPHIYLFEKSNGQIIELSDIRIVKEFNKEVWCDNCSLKDCCRRYKFK